MFSKRTMALFSTKYDFCKTTGCWIWNASKASGGYGQFHTSKHDGRKWYRAHRFSYEAYKGEIPEGMVVMHSCDNPACVNPDHLSVGTQADNMADRDAKGRGKWQMPSHRKHILGNDDLLYIISSEKSDKELAEMFNVNRGWIWKVKRGKIAWVRKAVRGACVK